MVSPRDKLTATEFICHRLEDSGIYSIQKRDQESVLAREKREIREEPRTIEVVIPNVLGPIGNFSQRYGQNRETNVYTSPVLYKDGRTAFVRMVERNQSWREDQSLKNYSLQQINQMLHLRGIEKAVMELVGDELTFYQPASERLEESLRAFQMRTVSLDYSHLQPGDQGYEFAQDRDSIDYKLPEERWSLKEGTIFSFSERRLARILPADSLTRQIGNFLRTESEALARGNSDTASDVGERIGIILDSCSVEERKRLTAAFGEKALGGYAFD